MFHVPSMVGAQSISRRRACAAISECGGVAAGQLFPAPAPILTSGRSGPCGHRRCRRRLLLRLLLLLLFRGWQRAWDSEMCERRETQTRLSRSRIRITRVRVGGAPSGEFLLTWHAATLSIDPPSQPPAAAAFTKTSSSSARFVVVSSSSTFSQLRCEPSRRCTHFYAPLHCGRASIASFAGAVSVVVCEIRFALICGPGIGNFFIGAIFCSDI